MLKATVKSLLAHSAQWSGRLRAHEARRDGALSILCFHRVLPAAQRAAYFDPVLAITPEAFDTICATLARHARVLPLAEAVAAVEADGPDAQRVVALTFDDGYRDNALHAAPILERHGLRASFYVVADLLGTPQPPWYDRLGRVVQELSAQGQDVRADGTPAASADQAAPPTAVVAAAKQLDAAGRRAFLEELESRLPAPPQFDAPDQLMDFELLRALQDAGHEIGSHSCSHEILPLLDDAALRHEIQESKRALEAGGLKVRSFCFPNGDYDARCLEWVREAGYEAALTTQPGVNPAGASRFELHRHFVHQDSWAGPLGGISPAWVRFVTAGLNDASSEEAA